MTCRLDADLIGEAPALVHDLTVATRNSEDFPREVKTVNPWMA